jgi:hypothetical protein
LQTLLEGSERDIIYCRVETSDFDAKMYGIKFWKEDENLRQVYKKPVYEEMKTFFL